MVPGIEELVHAGYLVKLTVTGSSMYPFLRHGVDSVGIESLGRAPKKGDILFYQRGNGQYVLHRVIGAKGEELRLAGDAQNLVERQSGWDNVIGIVSVVYRSRREISCGALFWRMFSCLWRWALPFRPLVILLYRTVRGRFRSVL